MAPEIMPFPDGFQTRQIPANGTTLHVRSGGTGPAAILLHGYGETGDMWAPPAAALARDHTAFDQDAVDNRGFLAQGKLAMPVLAVGGEKSFAATMAVVMRAAASDVEDCVIPGSGHWLMEEQPADTVAAIRAFLDRRR
jgi:pimeloyl-ACP methyl ester carboxylesterase